MECFKKNFWISQLENEKLFHQIIDRTVTLYTHSLLKTNETQNPKIKNILLTIKNHTKKSIHRNCK